MNIGEANCLHAKRSEIQHAIRHATTQIVYWKMKQAQTELRDDKLAAAALLLAWEMNHRCKLGELATLNGKAAA